MKINLNYWGSTSTGIAKSGFKDLETLYQESGNWYPVWVVRFLLFVHEISNGGSNNEANLYKTKSVIKKIQ